MFWLLVVIVGLIVGFLFNPIFFRNTKFKYGGIYTVLLVALVGSYVGGAFFGKWAWVVKDYNIIAGIVFAIVLNLLWDLFAKDKAAKAADEKKGTPQSKPKAE